MTDDEVDKHVSAQVDALKAAAWSELKLIAEERSEARYSTLQETQKKIDLLTWALTLRPSTYTLDNIV